MEEDKNIGRPMTFKEWIQRTFTDHEGIPSFKRQFALLVFIFIVVAVMFDKPTAIIESLGWLVGGILGITGVEKFSKH